MKEDDFGILMHCTSYCGCECVYGGIVKIIANLLDLL